MNNDMTQGRILPVLIRFTIPILLGDLFQQFYNIVDSVIVGRTLGTSALAAVGANGTLMFLIIGVCGTLAGGFAVVTAQYFGAHDEAKVRKSFANGLFLILAINLAVTLVFLFGIRRILTMMNTPSDIYEDAYAYIRVIILGLEATALYNYFASNLRAIGNSRIPLYFLILSSVTNIVLDFLLIVGFGMGVDGASTATILSQLLSVVLCIWYIIKKEPLLCPRGDDWKLDRTICLHQLAIGVPMAIQNAITASGTVVMQAATNIFGSVAVAANTAANKVRMVFTQALLSMGQSIATYCGQNYGNGNMKRVREGVFLAIKVEIVYCLFAMVGANLVLPYGMRFFLSDAAELAELMPWASVYMKLSTIFFIPLGFIFIFRSALQSCDKSVFAMSAGFVELFCRIAFAYLAIHRHSYVMAVMCDCAAWFAAGVYTCVAFLYFSKRMNPSGRDEIR